MKFEVLFGILINYPTTEQRAIKINLYLLQTCKDGELNHNLLVRCSECEGGLTSQKTTGHVLAGNHL